MTVRLPLTVSLTVLFSLGCMCGGGPEAASPDAATWQAGAATGDDALRAEAPEDEGEVAAPTEGARPHPSANERGGWPASITGVCEMEATCGCLEKATVEACAASLGRSASVFTPDVLACIVGQSCPDMCGGGAVACVERGAARQSAQLRADHETRMGILDNFPNGGPCANGQTQVTDSRGAFLRCE